ncbi:MAG: hypothetical protein JSR72_15040 [Proteobacteria bacterium]|nr:hypothetical protein [Pseudomonadota bacterium]
MSGDGQIPGPAVKADYFERPDIGLVKLIREYIKQFGTPHLWWGHTHTKPPKGGRVTFLGKYSLPKTHRRREKWALCPCCSPATPKYFKQGLIAWFPDEGVIRCVGDQCYKTLDPEGYRIAMELLESEIAEQRSTEYLLSRLPKIPDYIRTIDANLDIVAAIDQIRRELVLNLEQRLAIDLWSELKDGMLRYVVRTPRLVQRSDGKMDVAMSSEFRDFGRVDGHIALNPAARKLALNLSHRKENLLAIYPDGDIAESLRSMTEVEKKKISKILSGCHNQCNGLLEEAEVVRRFFSRVNASTINNWVQQDGVSLRVHLKFADDGFHVGRSETGYFLIKWPDKLWHTLTRLEPLSQPMAA